MKNPFESQDQFIASFTMMQRLDIEEERNYKELHLNRKERRCESHVKEIKDLKISKINLSSNDLRNCSEQWIVIQMEKFQ